MHKTEILNIITDQRRWQGVRCALQMSVTCHPDTNLQAQKNKVWQTYPALRSVVFNFNVGDGVSPWPSESEAC